MTYHERVADAAHLVAEVVGAVGHHQNVDVLLEAVPVVAAVLQPVLPEGQALDAKAEGGLACYCFMKH